jgi:hypothetical protein
MTAASIKHCCVLPSTHRRALGFVLLAVLIVDISMMQCDVARADGGKLQASEHIGPWIVTLFTSPTPPVAGLVDVSALVQWAETNEPVMDATVQIIAREASGSKLQQVATREMATNKLFQAAWLDLPTAGRWTVTAQISRDETMVETAFDFWVSATPPPWSDLTVWILWPIAPIALYAIVQLRMSRRSGVAFMHHSR